MSSTLIAILLLCLTYVVLRIILKSNSSTSSHLPPGPFSIPLIGNIFQLRKNPHQTLARLSKVHGPLMHLKLGTIDTIIVSSPELAREILQKHDHSFPGRRIPVAACVHGHHIASLACLPVGKQWRILRKICKEHMFSEQQLNARMIMRRDKVQKLVEYIENCCVQGRGIDIGKVAFVTSLNLISTSLFSVDFADYESDGHGELKGIIRGLMRVLGSPNFSDYFGILQWLDLQGIRRKSGFYMRKLVQIFDGIIDRRMMNLDERSSDFLDALLHMNGEDQLTRHQINHLLLDLFIAGTETSSSTVEWVMTELLRNPHIMLKVRLELHTMIGQNNQVEEIDIPRLPYLQATIKESLRYHPPGPFLARQKGKNDDCLRVKNYRIPGNALVLINLWAIGRDPIMWKNSETFMPERFINRETIDIKGQNFELIPFGAGRRICPGLPLAYRVVHLMVASLVHNFDWKLDGGMQLEDIDISEKFGVSLQKATSLKVVPLPIT